MDKLDTALTASESSISLFQHENKFHTNAIVNVYPQNPCYNHQG